MKMNGRGADGGEGKEMKLLTISLSESNCAIFGDLALNLFRAQAQGSVAAKGAVGRVYQHDFVEFTVRSPIFVLSDGLNSVKRA